MIGVGEPTTLLLHPASPTGFKSQYKLALPDGRLITSPRDCNSRKYSHYNKIYFSKNTVTVSSSGNARILTLPRLLSVERMTVQTTENYSNLDLFFTFRENKSISNSESARICFDDFKLREKSVQTFIHFNTYGRFEKHNRPNLSADIPR